MFARKKISRSFSLSLRFAAAITALFSFVLQLQATETTITVRYRSAQTVYLDAGSLSGLEVGDRLEVIHGVDVVAQIQVIFAADHSASCSILEEKNQVTAGDLARQLGEPSSTPIEIVSAPVLPPADDAAKTTEDEPTIEEVIQAQAAELALAPSAVAPGRWQPPRGSRKRTTQVSGTIIAELENFTDESEAQKLDFQRLGARVSMRILDIGGHPYSVRVRARTQQNRRSFVGSTNVPIIESRDRFYELSLAYDPPQGRFAYRLGRMSASPFVGIGYVDGFLGQMALTSSVEVGGFVGSHGNIEELGFDTNRQTYGLFSRFTSSRTDSGMPWEVIVAGVRQQGMEDISREYVTLQSRFSGRGRFSFYQRTEVDLNRGWRKELSGKDVQVSNLSLVGTAQLSKFSRLSISYDRFEPYRTEESRPLPEEIFSNFLRQGWRANLYFGKPRGINFSLNAGYRDQEGQDEKTISYGLGVRYTDVASVGLTLGGNLLGFSNPFNKGTVATFRASQPIRGGHMIDVTLGNRISTSLLFEDSKRKSYWARAGAWIQLPRRLFANAEYELGKGDDLQGQRISAGLGYRF